MNPPPVLHPPLIAAALSVPVGLIGALATPAVGLGDDRFLTVWHFGLPALTGLVIVWNLIGAIRLVRATGRPHLAWPFTLALWMLFTLLFFQIACHAGADHFRWGRSPVWGDWVLFSAAHALRAGDLFDYLDAYQLDLQPIHHDGILMAALLVAFHFILDLFVVSVLMEGVYPAWRRARGPFEGSPSRGPGWRAGLLLAGSLVFLAAWLITALWAQPWRPADLWLWPLDNLLRVVDLGDAMQLFEVRLSRVPQTAWEGTLSVACRTLLGLCLGGLLSRLVVSFARDAFGAAGWTRRQLEEALAEASDPVQRERIEARLAGMERARVAAPVWHWGLVNLGVAAGLTGAFLLSPSRWPGWDTSAIRLAEAAAAEGVMAPRGLAALRRLGPYAEIAAGPLTDTFSRAPQQRQQAIGVVLVRLGRAGERGVGDVLRAGPERPALTVIPLLRERGPRGVRALVLGLQSSHAAVRDATEEALLHVGRAAVGPIAEAMTPQNAARSSDLLRRLDPDYWWYLDADNPVYRKATRVPRLIAALSGEYEEGAIQRRRAAIEELKEIGPAAVESVPALCRLLDPIEWATGSRLLRDVAGAREPHPRNKWPAEDLKRVVTALQRISPTCEEAIPALDRLQALLGKAVATTWDDMHFRYLILLERQGLLPRDPAEQKKVIESRRRQILAGWEADRRYYAEASTGFSEPRRDR